MTRQQNRWKKGRCSVFDEMNIPDDSRPHTCTAHDAHVSAAQSRASCGAEIHALCTGFDKSGCEGSAYSPQLWSFVQCARGARGARCATAGTAPSGADKASGLDEPSRKAESAGGARASDSCRVASLQLEECLANSGCDPSQCVTPFGAFLQCIISSPVSGAAEERSN